MREKIYIIPTRYGLMYGGGVIITLIAGTIFSNNLIYLLCFFLVALFVIGMVQTNTNLKRLELQKLTIPLVPENGMNSGVIWIKSKSKEDQHQLKIELREQENKHTFFADRVQAGTLTPIRFGIKGYQRGHRQIHRVHVSTVFPFGLFYSWRYLPAEVPYDVYPQPLGSNELPTQETLGESLVDTGNSGDDFSEHKRYEPGISQRHIDWKAFARGRPLLVKNFSDGERNQYFLDFNQTRGGLEDRLKQMSLWVHICYKKKFAFSMRLGQVQIPANIGLQHRNACLQALAKFEGKDYAS